MFVVSLLYRPIFIIQIIRRNIDSLSTSGRVLHHLGLLMGSVGKSNANWPKPKGDSWAPLTVILSSGMAGSRVHLCSPLWVGVIPRQFPLAGLGWS